MISYQSENISKRAEKLYIIEQVLFIAMVALRLVAIYNTDVMLCTHDEKNLSDWVTTQYGHWGYMQYLYQHRSFPDTFYFQYYHPPLFHIVGALLMWVLRVDSSTQRLLLAIKLVQMVNCLASIGATFFCWKTLRRLSAPSRIRLTLSALLFFFPPFFHLARETNNDAFMALFVLGSVYFTVEWYRKHTLGNILRISVCIILGMWSKSSALLVAPAIGSVFLYVLITEKENRKSLLRQYGVFSIVTIPLGLAWLLHNYFAFRIPFNYVHRAAETTTFAKVSELSAWERYGLPAFSQLKTVAVSMEDIKGNGNIWMQTIRTMNSDEMVYWDGNRMISAVGITMQAVSIVIVFLLLFGSLIGLCGRQIGIAYKSLFTTMFGALFGSYLLFSVQFPYIYTMNFRYIVPCIMPLTVGCSIGAGTMRRRTIFEALLAVSVAAYCVLVVEGVYFGNVHLWKLVNCL